MPREKRTAVAVRPTANAKAKHRLRNRENVGGRPAAALVAKLDVPKISKHKTYFEFAENADKKKKLEVEVTDKKEAPPGFTFVPFGNPELTSACKEISRENEAMIFIVSDKKETKQSISDHVHRLGYHFRSTIVEQASIAIGGIQTVKNSSGYELRSQAKNTQATGDPIPATQEEINAQADGAIRDLFPRIPNTDREMIIQHAFQMGAVFMGKPVVGLQKELTLSRRVQLAVIAHVRHTHTRYDMLLRETDWATARAMVEPVCLDIIVKWRGDEETGRDQLDEVLREVVVISDSENSDDEDGDADESSSDDVQEIRGQFVGSQQPVHLYGAQDHQRLPPPQPLLTSNIQNNRQPETNYTNKSNRPGQKNKVKKLSRKQAKNARVAERKGFKRYRAWNEALSRQKQIPLELDNPDNQPQYSPTQIPHGDELADKRERFPASTVVSHQHTGVSTYPGSLSSTVQGRFHPGHADTPVEAIHRRKVILDGRKHSEESYARQPVRHVIDHFGSSQHYTEASRRPEPRLDGMRSPGALGLQDLLVPSIEKGPSEGIVVSTPWEQCSMHDERVHVQKAQRYPMPLYTKPGLAELEDHTDSNGIRYKRQRIASGEILSRAAIRDVPVMVSTSNHRRDVSPQRHLRHPSISHDSSMFVDLVQSPQRGDYPYSRCPREQTRLLGPVQQHGNLRGSAMLPTRSQRDYYELDLQEQNRQNLHGLRHVVSRNTRDQLPAHIIARENKRSVDDWPDRGIAPISLSHPDLPVSRAVTGITRPLERVPGAISSDQSFHSLSRRNVPGYVRNEHTELFLEDPRYGRGTGFVREAHQHSNGAGRGFHESTLRPESPRPVFRVPTGYNPSERIPQTRLLEHQKHLPIYDAPPRGAIPVRRHPDENNVRYEGTMRPEYVRPAPRRDIVVLD